MFSSKYGYNHANGIFLNFMIWGGAYGDFIHEKLIEYFISVLRFCKLASSALKKHRLVTN